MPEDSPSFGPQTQRYQESKRRALKTSAALRSSCIPSLLPGCFSRLTIPNLSGRKRKWEKTGVCQRRAGPVWAGAWNEKIITSVQDSGRKDNVRSEA